MLTHHKEAPKRAGVDLSAVARTTGLASLIILSNSPLRPIFSAIGNLIPRPVPITSCPENPNLAKWAIPPANPAPEWLYQQYPGQLGIDPPNILRFPRGADEKLRLLSLCHPIINSAVNHKMETMLHTTTSPTREQYGDFLHSIYLDLKSRLVFPVNYSEEDKIRVLWDMTSVTAATISNQFITVSEAQIMFTLTVQPGASDDRPISIVYYQQQPRVLPVDDAVCFDLEDILLRCRGHDRTQHATTHGETANQFLAAIEAKHPEILKTGLIPGNVAIEVIANLPIPAEQKAELLSALVGVSWETLWESPKGVIDSLGDVTVAQLSSLTTGLKILAEAYKTGIGDPTVDRDLKANHDGAELAVAARHARTEQELFALFEQANQKFSKSDRGNGTRLAIAGFQKKLHAFSQLVQRFNIPDNVTLIRTAAQALEAR